MSAKRQKSSQFKRPPRIRVPNNEAAIFTIGRGKIVGTIKRLSLTGGSVVIPKASVASGMLAEMQLETVFGRVTAQVQFLRTGADGLPNAHAFQFVDMDPLSLKRFNTAVEQMHSAGFSDVQEEETLFKMASRALGKIKDRLQ